VNDRPRGPLTPREEQELMQRLASGDDEAVRAVYRRFSRPVYTMGLRMLGSEQSAEELTQDVFVAAWRKAGRYDPARGRLSTWLMAIAHNMAVDRIRRDAARPARSAVPLDDLIGLGTTQEEAMLDRETVRRALADLSAGERKLLELAYFRGWTAREIAQSDGIPLGTVKTRIRTILIKLRRGQKPEEA
jgi:RNA polymerase sigma-70 factor (ECF subfamily)